MSRSRHKVLVRTLLIAGFALFVLGAFAPAFSITRLVVFDSRFSLVSGIFELYRQNELFLAALIAAFSGLAPLVKFAGMWLALSSSGVSSRTGTALEHLGRWSMLEVFVVALMVVVVKLGAIASVSVHWGAYALAGSAIASLIASGMAVPKHDAHVVPGGWLTFASGLFFGGCAALLVPYALGRADVSEFFEAGFSAEPSCIERVLVGATVSMQSATSRDEHLGSLEAIDASECPEDFQDAFSAHRQAWRVAIDPAASESFLAGAFAAVKSWFVDDEIDAAVAQRTGVPAQVRSTWERMDAVAAEYGVQIRRPDW